MSVSVSGLVDCEFMMYICVCMFELAILGRSVNLAHAYLVVPERF